MKRGAGRSVALAWLVPIGGWTDRAPSHASESLWLLRGMADRNDLGANVRKARRNR